MGDSKKNKTKKQITNKTQKKQNQRINQSFWGITKSILREAGIWVIFGIIISGIYSMIIGIPFLFTMHRSLYLIGMGLGIYAIIKSLVIKQRGLKDKEARKQEADRVRKLRNIEIYRGFTVMAVALILELFEYFIL